MAQEGYLHIWGKNYPQPVQLRHKVLYAAAGENHVIFTTSSRDNYGMGSNRFGQLGLKEPQFYNQPVSVFQHHVITAMFCGAEHSFFITDKNQVYSCGLNIKGQLGHYHFENQTAPKIVVGLLPFGTKNNKSNNPNFGKAPKSPIVEILEKFDLQVKIQDPNQKIFLLANDEFIIDIACGALFTLALSNRGKVFVTGLIGGGPVGTLEQQLEKSRFKELQLGFKAQSITAGLSGAGILASDGSAYILGRFGKIVINVPKRVERQRLNLSVNARQTFCEVKIGDQCAFALTTRGQILGFGENIDNQLGCEKHELPAMQNFSQIPGAPFSSKIWVGRNSVFAAQAETGQLYGWGSNRYGQIIPVDWTKGLLKATNLKLKMEDTDRLFASSYFTLLFTKRGNISAQFKQLQREKEAKKESEGEVIKLSEYKKLLQDYQLLKAINMTLMEKSQPARKENKEVQTSSKFQISGVTQYRKFNSNTEIAWKQLQIQGQINEGGYGIIYRARWRQIPVVVKKFKIQNGDVSLRDFLSECHAMEAVRHPNIVMFLGAVLTNPNYSIILEYCSKGSLWSYLQNKENNITWEDRRRFAMQIAQGVLYLHSCSPPILHRDLKSLNIFLDVNLRIKIGDFGWTKTLEEYMTNKIGTYQWMAPEVIGSKPYSEKADVFSYSIILWEIASREPPYRNINGTKVSEEVLNRELRPAVPPKCPEAFAKLMRRCWESDPSKRPNFREVIRELQVMKLNV